MWSSVSQRTSPTACWYSPRDFQSIPKPWWIERLTSCWASGGPAAILRAMRVGLVQEVVARHDLRHEADAQRLVGVDQVAGERQLVRLRQADQLAQDERAADRAHHAAAHEEPAELGPVRGQADVAVEGDVHAVADGRAVDGGDRRLLEGEDLVERGLALLDAADLALVLAVAAVLGEEDRLEVVAGAEAATLRR